MILKSEEARPERSEVGLEVKLWLKGVKLQERPPPPENPVTNIPRTES